MFKNPVLKGTARTTGVVDGAGKEVLRKVYLLTQTDEQTTEITTEHLKAERKDLSARLVQVNNLLAQMKD